MCGVGLSATYTDVVAANTQEGPRYLPSKQPTRGPTEYPTKAPRNRPTKRPTITQAPTVRPSTAPSVAPTTALPSRARDTRPTKPPTKYPTGRPSRSPTPPWRHPGLFWSPHSQVVPEQSCHHGEDHRQVDDSNTSFQLRGICRRRRFLFLDFIYISKWNRFITVESQMVTIMLINNLRTQITEFRIPCFHDMSIIQRYSCGQRVLNLMK